MFVSPAVAGETVYVGSCSGVYYAFDRATGEVRWSYDTAQDGEAALFHGDPLLTDELVITGTDGTKAGYVYAFDRASGAVRWKRPLGGMETDLLRVDSMLAGVGSGGDLVALDLASGEERWRFSPPAGARRHRPATPALAGERLFVAGASGVWALAASSGAVLWERELGSLVTTPVRWLAGALYVGVQERRVHRLDPDSGEITASLELEDFPHHSLVPAGDLLLALLGRDRLAAIELDLARVRWQHSTGGEWMTFYPLVVGNRVLAGDDQAELFAFDLRDGAIAWSRRFEGVPRGLGHREGVAYVGTLGGPIYAFRMPGEESPAVAAAAPGVASPPAAYPTPSAGEAAVRRVVEGLIAADNAGNLDAVLAYYAEDARLLPPGEDEVGGKAAIAARYRKLLAENRLELEVESRETIVAGDWAFDRGRTRGRAVPRSGGEPRPIDDRYLMILRRGPDGAWRIARLIWQPQS